MAQERFDFRFLDFPQKIRLDCSSAIGRGLFALLNKRKRIPRAARNDPCREFFPIWLQQGADARRNRCIRSVFSHAPKPVFGIPVVRFTSMHDRVEKTAIGVFDGLSDGMRGIEVIVPKQQSAADEISGAFREARFAQPRIGLLIDPAQRPSTGPALRPNAGEIGRIQKLSEWIEHV